MATVDHYVDTKYGCGREEWTKNGASPYLHTCSGCPNASYINSGQGWNLDQGCFTFEDESDPCKLGGSINNVYLRLYIFNPSVNISGLYAYVYDGNTWQQFNAGTIVAGTNWKQITITSHVSTWDEVNDMEVWFRWNNNSYWIRICCALVRVDYTAQAVIEGHNWRWYADDAPEPVAPLAGQNVAISGIALGGLIRLRFCIHTTCAGLTNADIEVQWSTDQVIWTDIGAQGAITQPWRWANGQATDQAALAGQKLTCTTVQGKYHEQACANCENLAQDSHHEIDCCIENYSAPWLTTYYFRLKIEGTGRDPESGSTNPQGQSEAEPLLGGVMDGLANFG
jgi:hypothetical protein